MTGPKHRADVPLDSCLTYRHGLCRACVLLGSGGKHKAVTLAVVTR